MKHIENLIIGAGPGGLQLAHDFKQVVASHGKIRMPLIALKSKSRN